LRLKGHLRSDRVDQPRVEVEGRPLQPRHQRALLRDSKRATEQRLAVDAPLPQHAASRNT
jgi:hypothetical protein